jgi:hypothetical protein
MKANFGLDARIAHPLGQSDSLYNTVDDLGRKPEGQIESVNRLESRKFFFFLSDFASRIIELFFQQTIQEGICRDLQLLQILLELKLC